MQRDFDYESNNSGFDRYTGEIGVKCKNYELCKAVLPTWWFECKNNYLCTNCHMMFGTWGAHIGKGILETYDHIECPICLETKKGISYPRCNHRVCIECFKRCFYRNDDESDNENNLKLCPLCRA